MPPPCKPDKTATPPTPQYPTHSNVPIPVVRNHPPQMPPPRSHPPPTAISPTTNPHPPYSARIHGVFPLWPLRKTRPTSPLQCYYERPCPYTSVGRNPARPSFTPRPSLDPPASPPRATGETRDRSAAYPAWQDLPNTSAQHHAPALSTRMPSRNTHPHLFSLRAARFSPPSRHDSPGGSSTSTELTRIHAPSPQVAAQPYLPDRALDALFSTYPPITDENFWARYDTPELVPPIIPEYAQLPPNTCTCGATGPGVYKRVCAQASPANPVTNNHLRDREDPTRNARNAGRSVSEKA
ncbi:hypothetical protein C8Q76DRAFT_695801 [Earliella scabrosa]|nr:hypothetical protein C8Q76DRAFT_695801 [Earliella scabrosa]